MSDQLLLTPEVAADRLSVSRAKTYQLIKSGELKSVKIGRSRRVPAAALVEYVERLGGGAA
jgi:excisionase family DNA binding protein